MTRKLLSQKILGEVVGIGNSIGLATNVLRACRGRGGYNEEFESLPRLSPGLCMTEYSPVSPPDVLGDDLPPVEPPSAGFIVQLFVVPAIIVLAVVAVWALFGRMAAAEQDWHRLVQDLDSANPHVSKRAMFGLATLLDNDQRLKDAGQHLAANPQIASALSRQLEKALQAPAKNEEAVAMQVYLARALGLLD